MFSRSLCLPDPYVFPVKCFPDQMFSRSKNPVIPTEAVASLPEATAQSRACPELAESLP
jgi:hypothetical protein